MAINNTIHVDFSMSHIATLIYNVTGPLQMLVQLFLCFGGRLPVDDGLSG